VVELTLPVLLESVRLPNDCHKDPADRMIIAAARIHQYRLLSYDQKIITYAQMGYLQLA
jgi:PIN domain nuclease of toxin-antitoxin system